MREMRKAAVVFVAAAALTLSVTPCAMGTTATQNNENIQAISTMAAAPDGSRKNPYDIKKGVKLKDSIGTTYLKLQAVYKGSSATKKARALTKKKNRSYLSYQLKKKGSRQFVVLKMYIKAADGFEKYSLHGSTHSLDSLGIYNKKVTNRVKNVGTVTFDKGRAEDVELYNGGHDTFYVGLLLPKSVKSFCTSESVEVEGESGFMTYEDCWMRYDI